MKTQIILTRRQIILETLRASGALFHWHPLLVDAALDLPNAFRRIDTLIGDPVFACQVDKLRALAPSLASALGKDVATSLRNVALPLEAPFLRSMRRNVLARMKLVVDGNRLLADEIDERVRLEYLRLAARYLPGRVETTGTVRTFGFKAFLEMQLPYKLRDIVRQCMAAFGRNDYVEDLDQRLIASSALSAVSDLSELILRAIRNALRSPREMELFEAFLAENGALAKFSTSDGSSAGKLRREIEGIFVRAAEELAGEGKAIETPRLLHCRQALRDMMPSRELASPSNNERMVPSRRRRFMLGLR